jgi:hypothetical protein
VSQALAFISKHMDTQLEISTQSYQARFNDEESTRGHLEGLQHLVLRRGGLKALPSSVQLPLSW